MTKATVPSSRPQHNGHKYGSDSSSRPERLKTKVSKTDGFSLGRQEIDLRYTEQLIDTEQTAALSLLLKYAVEHLIDGKHTLPEIVKYLQKTSHCMACHSLQITRILPAAMPSQDFRRFMPASIDTDALNLK